MSAKWKLTVDLNYSQNVRQSSKTQRNFFSETKIDSFNTSNMIDTDRNLLNKLTSRINSPETINHNDIKFFPTEN